MTYGRSQTHKPMLLCAAVIRLRFNQAAFCSRCIYGLTIMKLISTFSLLGCLFLAGCASKEPAPVPPPTPEATPWAQLHMAELTAIALYRGVAPPKVRFGALMHVSRSGTAVQSIEPQSVRQVERVRHATRVRRDVPLTATLACSGVTRVTRPGPL